MMTGQELYSLIQNLASISDRMRQIENMEDFELKKDYSVSGYVIYNVRKACEEASELITATSYEPIRRK